MDKQPHSVAAECVACRSRRNRWTVLIVVVTANIAYMGGHFAATLQARDRAGDAAVARFENFIRIADELGIINHERLNQVSASLAKGGNPWTDADGDLQNVKRIAGDGP